MAKQSLIQREIKRTLLYNKYKVRKEILLLNFYNTSDFEVKQEIHNKIQKFPKNSSKCRIKNRCWKTGRSRGYYRDFGLSRHVFREMAHQGLLPGIIKSSW
jgi:small subunit ribosomal protein S14